MYRLENDKDNRKQKNQQKMHRYPIRKIQTTNLSSVDVIVVELQHAEFDQLQNGGSNMRGHVNFYPKKKHKQ